MEFPNERTTRPEPYNPWSLATRYGNGYNVRGKAWVKYLVRQLSKVEGGMNGLTFTGENWTNQEVA